MFITKVILVIFIILAVVVTLMAVILRNRKMRRLAARGLRSEFINQGTLEDNSWDLMAGEQRKWEDWAGNTSIRMFIGSLWFVIYGFLFRSQCDLQHNWLIDFATYIMFIVGAVLFIIGVIYIISRRY